MMVNSRKEKNPGLGEWNYFPIFLVKKLRPEDIKPLAWVCSVRTLPVFFSTLPQKGFGWQLTDPWGGEGRWFRVT